jgi:hypothetical protein
MNTTSKRYQVNLACLERSKEIMEQFCKSPQKQTDVDAYRKLKYENDVVWGKALLMKE